MRFLLAFIAVLSLFISTGQSEWVVQSSGPVGSNVSVADEWRETFPGWRYHFVNGQLVGCEEVSTGERWTVTEKGEWSKNFGVDKSKICKTETSKINGHEVSKEQLKEILAAPQLPDDSKKLRLTIFSDDPKIKEQVKTDFKTTQLASWADKVLVQTYGLSGWVASKFQPITGNFLAVIQSPDGKVLQKQQDYKDGPEGLLKNLEAAKRKFDPVQVPDARTSWLDQLFSGLGLGSVDPMLVIMGIVILFMLLKGRASK